MLFQSKMSVEMLLRICAFLSINPAGLMAFAGNNGSHRFSFYRDLARSPLTDDNDPITEIRTLIRELQEASQNEPAVRNR